MSQGDIVSEARGRLQRRISEVGSRPFLRARGAESHRLLGAFGITFFAALFLFAKLPEVPKTIKGSHTPTTKDDEAKN